MAARNKVEKINTSVDTDYISHTSIEQLPDFCLDRIFQNFSIYDRIRIERVCKRWQHVSKDSWYTVTKLDSILPHIENIGRVERSLTTDRYILRQVLNRCGKYLLSLDLRKEEESRRYGEVTVPVIISETCQKLQVLNLSCYVIEVKSFLRMIPVCENLTKILFALLGDAQDCEDAIIKLLRKTRKMKHFWTHYAVVHFDSFPDSIEEFRLDGCTIKSSPNPTNFDNLHTLVLRKPKNFNDTSLEIISGMSNLKSLKLSFIRSHSQVTSNGMKHLSNLKNLQKLDIRGNRQSFTDEVMKEIAGNCKQIVFLNISHNHLTERGISELSKLKELRYLTMRNLTGVRGENLWRLSTLEILNCSYCYDIKTENLCTLVERSVDLKKIVCLGCNINDNLLEVAADATARRGNETVLNICFDFTMSPEKIAEIVNRSPKLRIYGYNIALEIKHESENCDGRFKDDDWYDSMSMEYDMTDVDTDDATDIENDAESDDEDLLMSVANESEYEDESENVEISENEDLSENEIESEE
ncbi:F-box/LRR-repeat protein 7-like [Belonocnema kinseyi]|uniref:F-box/LRR-repeat protein 7-like n=1 Tax=Belonocnema kinseyi TaxID=2817044 RepID=UPI00143DD47B|nr:F-box/LRR-repeat protein 7-like [Belonocnema kinseyi]XP_033219915.1 F-box/LRR-repeat protein 7-like [Belonocnema kinseyi]